MSITIIELISRKQKLFFSICFVLHSIQTVNLGLIRSWGGDEWFSYHDFTIMGLPFSILGEIKGGMSKGEFRESLTKILESQ